MDNYNEDFNDELEELAKNFLDSIENDQSVYFDIDDLADIFAYFNHNCDSESMEKVYATAQELYPDNYQTKLMEAQIYFDDLNFEKVIETLKDVTDCDDNPDFYLTIAPAYAELGKHEEAINNFLKALDHIDNDPIIYQIHLDIAIEYLKIDQFDEAIFHVNKSLEENNTPSDKYNTLYACCSNLHLTHKLKDFLLERIELNPYDDDAYFTLANIYSDENNTNESVKALEMALGINPNKTNSYFLLIDELVRAKRFNDALDYCIDALNNGINDPIFFNKISALCVYLNQPEKAIYYLQQGLKLFPDSSEIYEAMGIYYDSCGDSKKAITYLKKAIKIEDSYNAKINLVIIYLNNKMKYDECHKLLRSVECFADALPAEDKFSFYFNYSRLFILEEKFQEGADFLIQHDITDLNEEDIVKLSMIQAYCHYRSGQRDEALFIIETFAYDYPELFSFFWSWDSLSLVKDEELVRIKIKVETIISDRYEESLENEPEDDSE